MPEQNQPQHTQPVLTLQVMNGNELESGRAAKCVFTPQGGDVGHAGECHWSLQDRRQSIAERAFIIRWQDGTFCLKSYVANLEINQAPIAQNAGLVHLRQGDELRLNSLILKAFIGSVTQYEEQMATPETIVTNSDRLTDLLATEGLPKYEDSPADLPQMYRAERALQIICDKLQQVELKKIPRVENLLYFVQNTRQRFEQPPQKSNATVPVQTAVKTPVYAPGNTDTGTEAPHFPVPEMTVEIHPGTAGKSANRKAVNSNLKGFIAGIVCSLTVAAVFWWWQVSPMQQQLAHVKDTAQGEATVWLISPNLSDYRRDLQQLLDTSSLQSLETGIQMTRTADGRWPESLQQQQATALWHETLKARAQRSPQLKGWQQTRQDLRTFADLIMQREKEGLTLSYIKNVVWQAERTLNQETPLESLLTQYQTARTQGQNTQALEKEINERLDGVLSRWLLLKNNAMTESAASNRAEK